MPTPSSGRAFGDYELLDEIGRGGMGVVFRARQTRLNRFVALKMIGAGALVSPALIQRFHREAESAANLHHPNIVPIYESGEHEGQHFFSMELIDGAGLDRHLTGGGLRLDPPAGGDKAPPRVRPERIARIMAKVARSVDYAHRHGVLHRDLKPSNIILDAQGEPHLTDFGVAKVIDHDESSLTATGAVMGTPSYMSPEQAAGRSRSVTTAADIYGLGAILYNLLTGQPPFRADTPVETLKQVVENEPKHPTTFKDGADRDLATSCMKCLEKEPQRRYPSAAALADDLDRWLRREPIEARPAGPAIRLRWWVQRNPAPTLVIGSLCLGLVVSLALLRFAQKEENSKDRALAVIKQSLENRLDDLWKDTDATGVEPITAAELAAYAGLDWLNFAGPTNTLVFGVYTYRTPAKMLMTFAPILVTLGNKLATSIHQGVQIEMLIFRSYESALAALEGGRLDFMRMGPSSYVQIKARSPRVDLLVSQKHAEPLTVAIFTCSTNSGINELADLLGKSFAFGDTNSTTGNYVAKRLLRSQGLHGADFARYDYLETHADVMAAVLRGDFDAGAVNLDLVRNRQEFKTIGTSSLTNLGLCWVAGPSLAALFKNQLPHCFLLMNHSSVLTNLESKVTGFMRLDDSAFDELREMMKQADNFSE